MANKTFSQLQPAVAFTGSEVVPLNQNGITSKTTLSDIKSFVLSVGSITESNISDGSVTVSKLSNVIDLGGLS